MKFHSIERDTTACPRSRPDELRLLSLERLLLRSVSAFEVYRKVYRDVITPERVAELLMLRADMPRSLLASMHEVVKNLERVANDHSQETTRKAGRFCWPTCNTVASTRY